MQRRLDRLALNVEHARLQEHMDADGEARLAFRGAHAMPPLITVGISFMMPSRRATSV